LIELLAAIPSVVYGLWGIFVLAPWLRSWVEPALGSAFRLSASFQGTGVWCRHAGGRARARRHDRPVHRDGGPRSPARGAEPPARGGARPRRHALGDDTDRCSEIRPVGLDRRGTAGTRARARRNDGG